jgi:trimeric autotransporter adhesin
MVVRWCAGRMSVAVDTPRLLLRLGGVAVGLCLSLSCGSSSQSVTSPAGTRCAIQVQTDSVAFSPEGGGGQLRISTARECSWRAESHAGWVSLASSPSGQGDGSVAFTVAANADPAARSASIGVNDQQLQISQQGSPCDVRLSSTHESFDEGGGNRTVHVTSSNGRCGWTASSSVPWIAIMSGREGSGSGAVTFHVSSSSELPRSGALTVAGHSVLVQQGTGCSYAVDVAAFTLGADGGAGQVQVSAPPGCEWTAESQTPWVTIASGAEGSGAGVVTFQAAPSGGGQRSGTILAAGRVVTVTQSAVPPPECRQIAEPTSFMVPAAGGPGVVALRTGAGCGWSAVSTVPWITITAGQSGTGPGEVRFAVAAAQDAARTGGIRIGPDEVTIRQERQPCSFAASPVSVTATAQGGSGSIQVTAGAGCAWTARSGAPWITFADAGGGTGTEPIAYLVAANSGPARQATLTVAGHAITVSQASGCTYDIAPSVQDVPPSGGGGAVGLKTAAGCAWSAASAAAWLTVSPASGAGAAQVQLTAALNNGLSSRSTTVTIAGRTTTVNQGSPCTWHFAPERHDLGATGGGGTVLVNVNGGCTWTAESTAPWITITPSAAGMVQFQVAPNAGPARTGIVTIGGVPYTVNQQGP